MTNPNSSQTSQQPSILEQLQEEERLKARQQIREFFSEEEQDLLIQLPQDKLWKLLLRYLDRLEAGLAMQMWNTKLNVEGLRYAQGQKRTVDVLRRIPDEMKEARQNSRRQDNDLE